MPGSNEEVSKSNAATLELSLHNDLVEAFAVIQNIPCGFSHRPTRNNSLSWNRPVSKGTTSFSGKGPLELSVLSWSIDGARRGIILLGYGIAVTFVAFGAECPILNFCCRLWLHWCCWHCLL
jgi:hypothetical protein